MKAKDVSAKEAFNAEWPTLKEKYLKWRKSADAYTEYLNSFKITAEREAVKEYRDLYHIYVTKTNKLAAGDVNTT